MLLAILVSMLLRKMHRGRLNRAFIQLGIILILSCSFDILRVLPYTGTALEESLVFRFVMGYIFIFLRAVQMPMLIRIYALMSGGWSRIKSDPKLAIPYFGPLLAFLGFCYSIFFTQRIFYYTLSPNGVQYVRGNLMTVYDYFGFYFLVFSLVQVFVIRKRLSTE